METITFDLGGMSCDGCASSVIKVLVALHGVSNATVSHAQSKAEIHYNPAQIKPEQLRAAIEAAGYFVQTD